MDRAFAAITTPLQTNNYSMHLIGHSAKPANVPTRQSRCSDAFMQLFPTPSVGRRTESITLNLKGFHKILETKEVSESHPTVITLE